MSYVDPRNPLLQKYRAAREYGRARAIGAKEIMANNPNLTEAQAKNVWEAQQRAKEEAKKAESKKPKKKGKRKGKRPNKNKGNFKRREQAEQQRKPEVVKLPTIKKTGS